MESFSVFTLLTKEDYRKYLFSYVYKRPTYIAFTAVGLFFICLWMAQSLHLYYFTDDDSLIVIFVVSCFLLLRPLLTILIMYKRFINNPRLQQPIQYVFEEENIIIKGDNFESKLNWDFIIRFKEWGNYFLLYGDSQRAHFINANDLTVDEKTFIRQKLSSKK